MRLAINELSISNYQLASDVFMTCYIIIINGTFQIVIFLRIKTEDLGLECH